MLHDQTNAHIPAIVVRMGLKLGKKSETAYKPQVTLSTPAKNNFYFRLSTRTMCTTAKFNAVSSLHHYYITVPESESS